MLKNICGMMNVNYVREYCKLMSYCSVFNYELLIYYWLFRDDYQKTGVDCLFSNYAGIFGSAKLNLWMAFQEVFKENRKKELNIKNWIEEVQNALTEHLPGKVHEEEMKGTPAFIDLCLKATEINKHFSDIQKLIAQFKKCWMPCCADENSEKQKLLLIEETQRLIKVMGEIAVLLNIPFYIDHIQGAIYDMEKGGPQKTKRGFCFSLSEGNLSEEQQILTPIAWWYAHPSPKNLGNSSC